MEQTATPAADQTTDQTTEQAAPDATTTATPGPDLVVTAPAEPVAAAIAATDEIFPRSRAERLTDDLREIEATAQHTPNLGEAVARLAGLLADVLDEVQGRADQALRG